MISFLYHAKRKGLVYALLGGTLALTACGTTSPRQTFDLTSGHVTPEAVSGKPLKAKKRVQVLVPAPEALKAFDGQDIVVQGGYGSISYLKGAQWGDRLPNIVQAKLVHALEDSGRLGGVGRPGEGLAIDYQLITDIRAFGIEPLQSGSIAHVQIAAKLLNDKTGSIRATQVFAAQVPVSGTSNADYAKALDGAFAQVCARIVSWTLQRS